MQKFIDVLSSKLGVDSSEWDNGLASYTVNVPVDEKYSKHYTDVMRERLVYSLCTSSYCLQFSYINDTTVELGIIEVFNPGNGLGTDIMNHILDTSDELKVKIKTIPAPIVPVEDILYGKPSAAAFKTIQRLRRYYSSLGFDFSMATKAVMYYRP